MVDVNTGTSGTLRVTGSVVGSNAAGIWWDVAWSLQLIERVSAGSSFQLNPKAASVSIAGVGTVWSGTFTFDWRPSGLQSQTIASGTTRVFGPPSGSGAGLGNVTGSIADTNTSAAGGPTSATETVSLPTLTVPPGVPTGVTAARVSDSQATVSWTQPAASNGQPTSQTVRRRINGGAFADVVTISPATSTTVACSANQKLEYEVRAANAAGSTAWSATSPAIYTTPAAPTGVAAAKDTSLNIDVSWTPNVAFVEHEHVVEFSTNGGSSWTALATVAAGTSTYKHTSPNPALVHVYRVRSRNTSGGLTSAWVESNSVQLLAAPNAPTLPALASFADKATDLTVPFTHNPVDTTAQTAYEMQFSTNGGSSWSGTGKVTSAVSSRTIAANTYAADVTVTIRVRTWGQATTGGADGTGASAWSTTRTVTFKTRPTVTILSPADASTWTEADLRVGLSFAQAEDGTFVSATLQLKQGSTVLETVQSTTLASTAFATEVEDGESYTVTATVVSSHGITSSLVDADFSVSYTLPVAAAVVATYLDEFGITQLDVTIPTAGVGEEDAVSVSIFRTIDGVTDTLQRAFPVTVGETTFLDTTPTINGVNEYRVRTFSGDGAARDTTFSVTTAEDKRAFLSNGPGFSRVVSFFRALTFTATPTVATALVQTAGRRSPIALFGENRGLVINGSAVIRAGEGSTVQEIEDLALAGGLTCYRDPTGRRVFGAVALTVEYTSSIRSAIQYTFTEAT